MGPVRSRAERELLSRDTEGSTVAFSPDGDIVYSGEPGGLLRAWDLSGRGGFLTHTAGPLEAIRASGGAAPRISPTGDRVLFLSTSDKPQFRVHDVSTGRIISAGEVDQPVKNWNDTAWSPDSFTFNISLANPTVAVWDAATGRIVRQVQLPDGDGATYTEFTPDGRHLLVGTTSGRLHVLDARTLDAVRPPIQAAATAGDSGARAVTNLAASAGGRTTLVNFLGQPSRLVDYVDGQVRSIDVRFEIQSGAFSPDGKRLFVSSKDGSVGLLDVPSRRWIAPPSSAHPAPTGGWYLIFSPDGREVTSGGARWDGSTGAFLGEVPDFPLSGYSADGRRLVGAGGLGEISTWDLDPATWVTAACRMAGRDLTPAEWRSILPDRPPQKVCPS